MIEQPFKGRVAAASAEGMAAGRRELLEQPCDGRKQKLLEAAAAYDWGGVAKRLETVYQYVLSVGRRSDACNPGTASERPPTIHEVTPQQSEPLFDAYAENYDRVLNAALRPSGETKEYFAHGRLRWLASRLERFGYRARSVLDYGCGIGTSIPLFFEYLRCDKVIGLDVSQASLDCAARMHTSSDRVQLIHLDNHKPTGDIDLAFCNGVFHHIGLSGRATAVRHTLQSLRPGGVFAFWENNPWNPGTRYSMRVNPFDRDAVLISAREAARLLRAAGFQVVETTYTFCFPRPLCGLRRLEPRLSFLPFGAQYLLLARKPAGDVTPLAH